VIISDVDECATNTHTCTAGQICVNVYGGFRCLDNVPYTSGESTSLFDTTTTIITITIVIIIIIIKSPLATLRAVNASVLSICPSVYLFVGLSPKYKKNAIFSKTKQFRATVSIDAL